MSSTNIGYLFTQDFYCVTNPRKETELWKTMKLHEKDIKRKVDAILHTVPFETSIPLRQLCLPCHIPAVQESFALSESEILDKQGISQITLQILYPGLYAGMGYMHGQNGSDDDFKTGFSFDYTTGLPYLPGSSVKGALRACFTDRTADTLEALCDVLKSECNEQWLRCLEQRVFGSRSKESDTSAAMGTVIFYDAFPGKTSEPLMAEDYITPHPNPLKSPSPIKTIKVKPGICFDFFFRIPNIVLEAEDQQPRIEKKHVRELFERLLIDWGIGAKTNTGYGNLDAVRI